MARRGLPALLLLGAAIADSAGEHRLSLYALLLAIPAVAATALQSFGDLVATRGEAGRRLQSTLWAVVLALLVLGAALRGPTLREGIVPAFSASALVACLVALALEALVGLAAAARETK